MTGRQAPVAISSWRLAGSALVAVLAALLIAAPAADAAKRKNGIIFEIQTSQGLPGRITYIKNYGGTRNFVQFESEVLRTCVGSGGPYTERATVLLSGQTSGNAFFLDRQQNTSTDQFQQTATAELRPTGRKKGLPKWRRAEGTVRAFRGITDPFVQISCDSGNIGFTTVSSRRARFGPETVIIVARS